MALGSIVVRLTMSTADFETDSGRAAKIAEKRAKEIDAAFRKAGFAIGAALTSMALGITAATKKAIDHMDDVSKAAQRVQMPTEQFSALAYAGSLADVQMDTMVSTFGKLTRAQAAALDGSTDQAKVFDALGISIKDANGDLRPGIDLLLEFADVFAQNRDSPELMAAGLTIFGRSFQDLIPLIKDGSGAIREAMQESDALGKTLSDEAGRAAEEFNDNLSRLQTGLEGVVMQIASGMLPQLNEMTGDLVSAAKETDDLRQFGEGLVTILGGLGKAFGFVSGMARQMGIDAAAATEMLAGTWEIQKQMMSAGFADGTVKGGLQRIENAQKTRREMMESIKLGKDAARAQAEIDRLLRNGVQYDGPLLEGMGQQKAGSPNLAALRGALGPTRKAGGASRKAELTEEQKALQELQREYDSLSASMAERIGLFGAETEVARLNYEFQFGSLQKLDEAKKQSLMRQAEEIDRLNEQQRLEDAGRRLIESSLEPFERINAERDEALRLLEAGAIAQDAYNKAIAAHQTPAEQMLADLALQTELLGKSREEQERLVALWRLGGEAQTEAGRRAIDALDEYQKKSKETEYQVSQMDAVRDAFKGLAMDIKEGVKPVDALRNAFERLASRLFELAIDKVIEQIFGAMGSSGSGTSGGGFWASLFSGIASSYASGGARAYGGPVEAGRPYIVGEKNPELFIPNTSGRIVPDLGQIGSGAAGQQAITVVNVWSEEELANAISGAAGERVVVNHMQNNRRALA